MNTKIFFYNILTILFVILSGASLTNILQAQNLFFSVCNTLIFSVLAFFCFKQENLLRARRKIHKSGYKPAQKKPTLQPAYVKGYVA